MAKKTCCDVCGNPIADGSNVGLRNPIFTWSPISRSYNEKYGEMFIQKIEHPEIEIQIRARVDGKTDPDLCMACLKRAVAEA